MSATTKNMSLEQKVEYLLDRQAIRDCVCRYARGVDRHDTEILLSAFHPDAMDQHGRFINDMSKFAQWANAIHNQRYSLHLHSVTTHNCEIEGNVAHAETYVLYGLALSSGKEVWFGGGRYIDRLEKRDGEWKISLRRTVIDWLFSGDTYPMNTEYMVGQGYPRGTQDRSDISYQRPLKLGTE